MGPGFHIIILAFYNKWYVNTIELSCAVRLHDCMLSDLLRVKRLGYFDHTQRQLGERALYVFPAKGDATRITCEGPEGAPVLPEDPVIRKVRWIHAR